MTRNMTKPNDNSEALPEITIRRPHSPEEYQQLQQVQKKAWGITQDGYVVPVATMIGAQHHGGLVLGAFLPSNQAIGLSFSFMGRVHEDLCLYSQLTGVIPDFQGRGVGGQMKWAQWEYARTHDIPTVAWAFDPFQTGNAHFNFNRLRARSRRYINDMYGPRTDRLNAGAPTDRLIAEWATGRDPSATNLEPFDMEAADRAIETHLTANGYLVAAFVHEKPRGDNILLEIPQSLAEIQKADPEQANRWRSAVREAFHKAFQSGYVATDFIRIAGDPLRCYYRLERNVWVP